MEKIKKIIALISNKIISITQVFGILAFVVGALLLIYDARYLLSFGGGWDYINNIIVEAHGLFFDLLVLGVLISIYERRKQKKEAIERDENLIDDFRGWDEKEAMYRIVGAVKRLNKAGVLKINLRSCFLHEADLQKVNLKESDLSWAKLQGAHLEKAHLEKASLRGAHLDGAHFDAAHLEGTMLRSAHLNGAHFWKTHLEGANLDGADFKEADLEMAELEGALVKRGWFEKLEQWEVRGFEAIKEKYLIDENGRLQLK